MPIPENVRLTGKSLANALAHGDLKAAKKWADRLSALLATPPVAPPAPAVVAAVVAAVPVPERVLTYDEEHDVLISASDELLKAAGRPFGHEGAERGALPLSTLIDLCRKLDLPLHLAEFESFVVPGASQ